MVHRGIATISGALLLSFLWLGNLEPQFVLLHFYQSLIYLAIILMLFYFEDRYAYMLGMIAPAAWLILNYLTGILGGAMRQVKRLMSAESPSNPVTLVAAIIAVLSVLMIIFCAYRWKREYSGLGKGLSTFVVSLVVVIVYYGLLIYWFWHMVPD